MFNNYCLSAYKLYGVHPRISIRVYNNVLNSIKFFAAISAAVRRVRVNISPRDVSAIQKIYIYKQTGWCAKMKLGFKENHTY